MPRRDVLKNDLLRRHALIRTDEPERMRDLLFGVYKARKFEVRRGGGHFFARANRLQFEHVGFDYCAYGADIEVDFPAIGSLRQQICLSGAGETLIGRRRMSLSPDDTTVIPAGAAVETHFNASYRQLVLRIDPDALRRKLEAVIGDSVSGSIEFPGAASFRSPGLRSLRRLTAFFVDEMDRQGAQFPALALAPFEEALLVAFLYGHRHTYSPLLEAEALTPSRRQVQQAEAFIEAHWREPLTIEAISQAAGVSARSIFRAFKQTRGNSPMEFLKETRLSRARGMLSHAGPEQSVMEVAYACGFQSHGHFAREYREKFGESPSATLAHARRK